jgi:hypothetical protein
MIDMADFDAGLDAYQQRMEDEAWQAEQRSYEAAARPGAEPAETTFGELCPGDYMTNEGPGGRWVKVLQIDRGPSCNVRRREASRKPGDGEVSILFEIPEPVGVSGETRYWLDRPERERVLIDAAARMVAR